MAVPPDVGVCAIGWEEMKEDKKRSVISPTTRGPFSVPLHRFP